ncbi:DUF2334 domain-containing protein [Lachnospiraceae bacterium JLR.KK008]
MTNVCIFRLDDITPDMDWNRFYRVKAIFDKYRVRPLIGVVPDNADENLKRGERHEDFWEYIRCLEKSGWQIAQHGYRHVYETKNAGLLGLKKASEFAGLPYDVQYEKIRAGREILQKKGLNVTIFMAPGHTYDKRTLKALKNLGFTCVTDGFADIPYFTKGLLFVPCKSARPRISRGVDTVCLHCNELRESDYRELENFLETHGSQVIPFSEVLDQLWYSRRTLMVAVQEKRNLLLHRLKVRVSQSQKVQRYLQDTYDENPGKKKKKRLLGLLKLLFSRRKHGG